jgi:hypothetical protein
MCPFDCVVLQMASETYHNLKAIIKGKYGMESTSVGDEGGFAPKVQDSKEALDLVVEAIEAAGYTGKIEIGMDVAASEFYNAETKMYDLDFKTEGEEKDEKLLMPGDQLNDLYVGFCNDYPMASIEDPFDQEVGTWSIAAPQRYVGWVAFWFGSTVTSLTAHCLFPPAGLGEHSRLHGAHVRRRSELPSGRRRPARDKSQTRGACNRGEDVQRAAAQGESNRHDY